MKNNNVKKYNSFVKALSLMIALITVFSCFSLNVFAATAVSSVNCQPIDNKYGGQSKYFYVKASNTTCKIKFTCGKGQLDLYGGNVMPTYNVYGSYEIKIYKWDKNKGSITGSCLLDKDIYNKSSATLSFKAQKGSYYRIQVYFWNATTTATSYWNKNQVTHRPTHTSADFVGVAYYDWSNWEKFPSIKAANDSGCTLYSTKP